MSIENMRFGRQKPDRLRVRQLPRPGGAPVFFPKRGEKVEAFHEKKNVGEFTN